MAQRRSGVLPAPGALDARLPELLEVLAEPRAVLEADLFSALIEEIDLWASGLEAPPAILPAPPNPPVAEPLAPSAAAAPEASPKASSLPARSLNGVALPPDPPRIPAIGHDGPCWRR